MDKFSTLENFLEHKTLYYDKIDYDVIYKSWKILKENIKIPYVIHIIGTNGKGSTGRFLASFLNQLNKKVIHYTSPHIIKFNERIWIDGKDSIDKELDDAHIKLQQLLSNELLNKLTYFEYTTLLALYISDGYDYIVLEAGLGGEFDATNVVKNDLTLVPSIGLDHMEFLGDTIKAIATTKLKSCDRAYILGKDISNEIIDIANCILEDKKKILFDKDIVLPKAVEHLPKYLLSNLKLALVALRYLNLNYIDLDIDIIGGRCERIEKNITIDVGHNPLAAKVLVEQFKDDKIILVYNSFQDKDYEEVLKLFQPILKEVQIIKCDDSRMVDIKILEDICKKLNIEVEKFNVNNLSNKFEYLVFGSFKVVEEFLSLRMINR
ncbi:MAG: bifunctional folylpolyglutamate synthase/dihydrofolate synthase [Arcobacteraceae bacterium]|nr:bifunctional folylpolyglutamate synthase/dihydrofolate synthase [Arcobacteraceae bacterium]